MRIAWFCRRLALVAFTTPLLMGGCECSSKTPPAAAEAQKKPAAAADKPKEPLIKKAEVKDWCPEHGVPESVCTRCNSELIAEFKKKGDWCAKHDLPDSQCFECHPELKAKFEAMRP